MDYALAALTIKSIDDSKKGKRITGICSHIASDLEKDIVLPSGMKANAAPVLPLLLQHDHSMPIGTVTKLQPKHDHIYFEAELANVENTTGDYYKTVQRVIDQITAGVLRGISIGFKPIKSESLAGGGRKFLEYLVYEVSVCSVAMNPLASITDIKSAIRAERLQQSNAPKTHLYYPDQIRGR